MTEEDSILFLGFYGPGPSRGPYMLAEQAGPVKDLLHGIQTIFLLDTEGRLEWTRYRYLACSGNQSQRIILVN